MNNRIKFSGIYLFIATALLLAVIITVKNLWYPYPLLQAVGTQSLLMIIMAVNIGLMLGLAVMVLRKAKVTDFITDIIVSVFIQLLCLAVSVYAIYNIKPVWIAYNVDRFELILNTDLINTKINNADKKFKKPSYFNPQYVGVESSKNNEEHNSNMFDEVLNGISIAQRPERYVPVSQVKAQIKERAQNLGILEKYNGKSKIDAVLNKYPQADSFVPMQAKAVDMTVLLNKDNEDQIVAIVDLRPW